VAFGRALGAWYAGPAVAFRPVPQATNGEAMISLRPVSCRREIEPELPRQARADLAAQTAVRHGLHATADLGSSQAREIDRAQLMAKDDGILRLASLTHSDGHLSWVPGLSRRDRADRRHPRSMECLVRDDQGPTLSSLLMTDRRIEVDEDDGPAERCAHVGQESRSRNATVMPRISVRNSGSSAALAQRASSSLS